MKEMEEMIVKSHGIRWVLEGNLDDVPTKLKCPECGKEVRIMDGTMSQWDNMKSL